MPRIQTPVASGERKPLSAALNLTACLQAFIAENKQPPAAPKVAFVSQLNALPTCGIDKRRHLEIWASMSRDAEFKDAALRAGKLRLIPFDRLCAYLARNPRTTLTSDATTDPPDGEESVDDLLGEVGYVRAPAGRTGKPAKTTKTTRKVRR